MIAAELDLSVDGDRSHVSLTGLPVAEWHARLTRAATVPAHPGASAATDLTLPHDLLLASGAALRGRREDLLGELVARHAHQVEGGRPDQQLRLLHGANRGRLQAVVAGPHRRIGWVSWVLQPDGWRRLTPYVAQGLAMVRVTSTQPRELGLDVARLVRLVTGVR